MTSPKPINPEILEFLREVFHKYGNVIIGTYDPMFDIITFHSVDNCNIGCDEYQVLSRRTQNETLTTEDKRRHALFGLASEVGEIHSLFQHEYQGRPVQKERVLDECSDLCWFLSELLDTYGIKFSEVLEYNIAKLRKRYPFGFDTERSEKRHEEG